ncbi:MAG TPA: hypothetical protein VGJ84_22425 [Polyangiaceae bacterium]
MPGELPFDTVIVEEPGARKRYSLEQFLNLPLSERVRLILGRYVVFLKGNSRISQKDALAALRRDWTR